MSATPPVRHVREEGRITTRQFIWMLLAIIASGSGGSVPRLLLETARQDGWLTVLIAWTMDVALALVYAHMGLRFPGETFVEYASSTLGPWLGKPVGLIFPLFFFLVGTMQLRAITDLMGTIFLHGTPQAVIALACLIAAAYAARHGLEVTGRAAEVLGPVFLVSAATIVLMVSPQVRLEMLQPILENGLGPVLNRVPLALSFMAYCVVMGMFQAYHDMPRQAWLAKFSAVTVGATMISGIVILAVAVLGPDVAARSVYPDLQVARAISIADFLERLEVLWVLVSLGASIVALGVYLWAAALGIAQTFGLRKYKPLVIPLAGLMLPLSLLLFENIAQRAAFVGSVFPVFALLVEAGVIGLLWLVALLRNRRGIARGGGVEG